MTWSTRRRLSKYRVAYLSFPSVCSPHPANVYCMIVHPPCRCNRGQSISGSETSVDSKLRRLGGCIHYSAWVFGLDSTSVATGHGRIRHATTIYLFPPFSSSAAARRTFAETHGSFINVQKHSGPGRTSYNDSSPEYVLIRHRFRPRTRKETATELTLIVRVGLEWFQHP